MSESSQPFGFVGGPLLQVALVALREGAHAARGDEVLVDRERAALARGAIGHVDARAAALVLGVGRAGLAVAAGVAAEVRRCSP